MENKHKHLEMIQGIVNRLSTNSFLLKGWSVVLVSALFAMAAPDARLAFILLAYIPAAIFWGLDGYFLQQERLYLKLYDHVRKKSDDAIDFSMNTGDFTRTAGASWASATFSKTLIAFHGVLILAIAGVTYLATKP